MFSIYSDIVPEGGRFISSPFRCCHLPEFIASNDSLLDRLHKQLFKLPMLEKSNDMYKVSALVVTM